MPVVMGTENTSANRRPGDLAGWLRGHLLTTWLHAGRCIENAGSTDSITAAMLRRLGGILQGAAAPNIRLAADV